MASQQIVDYIAAQLKAGFSETKLREHLKNHGWSQPAIDGAFAQLQPVAAKSAVKTPRRGARPKIPRWKTRRWLQAGAAVAIVVVAAVGSHLFLGAKVPKTPVTAAAPLSFEQKQALDVNTIAGVVGQFAATNGVLPARLSAGPGGSGIVMCDKVCDPTTSQSSPLLTYQPSNVKIVAYVADLTVPNEQIVYLVPQAKCQDPTAIGAPNLNPRSMVLLYAASTGASISQRCLTL